MSVRSIKQYWWIILLIVLSGVFSVFALLQYFQISVPFLSWSTFQNKKDEILVVYDMLPRELDPYSLTMQKRQVSTNIYDGLTQIDRLYRAKPALALSWGNIDEKTWEFKLRKEVHFHNKALFTSQDVIASFEKAKMKAEPELNGILENISDMKAVDTYTVHIKTKLPDPLLLTKLSFLLITSAQETSGTKTFSGTGPYLLKDMTEGAVTLERNDEYWGQRPTIKKVSLRALPDKYDRFTELMKGSIDILAAVPPSQENIDDIKNSPTLDLLSLPSLELVYLMFNNEPRAGGSYNPFSDPVVRKAVSLALNQDQIVSFGEGFARPVNQYIASGILGYNPDLPKKIFSLDEAKKTLGNRRFTMKLYTTNDFKIIAEYLRVQLEPLGVNVEYTLLKEDEFLTKLRKKEMQSYILGWRFDLGDSLEFFKTHIHSTKGAYGQYNASGYKNAQVDELVSKAESELNENSRLTLLQEIQKIVQKDTVGVPLFETQHLFVKKKILNWEPRLDGLILFQEVH